MRMRRGARDGQVATRARDERPSPRACSRENVDFVWSSYFHEDFAADSCAPPAHHSPRAHNLTRSPSPKCRNDEREYRSTTLLSVSPEGNSKNVGRVGLPLGVATSHASVSSINRRARRRHRRRVHPQRQVHNSRRFNSRPRTPLGHHSLPCRRRHHPRNLTRTRTRVDT